MCECVSKGCSAELKLNRTHRPSSPTVPWQALLDLLHLPHLTIVEDLRGVAQVPADQGRGEWATSSYETKREQARSLCVCMSPRHHQICMCECE
jgi:hypothetical protein